MNSLFSITLLRILFYVFQLFGWCFNYSIAQEPGPASHGVSNKSIAHSSRTLKQEALTWRFDGKTPDPEPVEYIMPSCPCEKKNTLCHDYDYCYCQLGYSPPVSEVTGEPFLDIYGEHCFPSNSSKPSDWNTLPLLQKYLSILPPPDWDCNERSQLSNKLQLLYPYFCVRKLMFPTKGTSYYANLLDWSYTSKAYKEFLRKQKYFWSKMEDSNHPDSTLLQQDKHFRPDKKNIGTESRSIQIREVDITITGITNLVDEYYPQEP